MSKEKVEAVDGLEEVVAPVAVEEAAPKAKKVQTPEDKTLLEAGVAKLREIGVSPKLSQILDLVPYWNDEKETLAAAKDAVIAVFEGSDKLKDFVDSDFQAELAPLAGLAKVLPVLNNIKSFYARRENAGTATKKFKTIKVSIAGKTYDVNATYFEETAGIEKEARRELLLAHADTKEAVLEVL